MKVEDQQLKSFILDAGLIPAAVLDEIQKEAKKKNQRLEDLLIEKKLIDESRIIQLKAYILGIPFIDLKQEIEIPPEILQIIPEPIARKNNVIAYHKRGKDELEVAMQDPRDLQTIEFIQKKTGLKILPRLTDSEGIKNALKQYQKSIEDEFGEFIKKESGESITVVKEEEAVEGENLEKMAEDMPIIRIVDAFIKHAVLQGASDIHIEPTEKDVIVRYRIDGILRDAMTLPKKMQAGVVARIKVLSSLKLDEHRLPQDGRFKIETADYRVSFRVSTLPVYDGEKVVMRLLPEGRKSFSLEELGMFGKSLEVLKRSIDKPVGMILATGPTGSGKTTTLYTVLTMLNTPDVNISTVEDPIEYRQPRINQTQVKSEIGLTFANGLRALLRQDPDIIMVGEIRDEETASLAVNAALTGHQVLSTLHTNSAAGAIPRLIDMEVKPFLIASTVNTIIAQRLVRTLYKEKQKYNLTKEEVDEFRKEFNIDRLLEVLRREKIVEKNATWETIDLYKPIPSHDAPDGYKGRIGIREVLDVTPAIKDLIVRKATSDEIQKKAQEEGMLTMLEDGFVKAVQGITSIEEILRVTKE
jgi:type IV pilus assembly protein PilB